MSSDITEVVVPLAFFGMIGGIWVSSIMAGQKERSEINETARRAIEVGQPLSPETFSFLQKPVRPPEHDLRTGIILCALAFGFFAASLAFPEKTPTSLGATANTAQPASKTSELASTTDGAPLMANESAASPVIAVVQSPTNTSVKVTSNHDGDEPSHSKIGRANIEFDGDGFRIPGMLVGFLGIGHLISWAIRRKKSA